MQQLAANHKAAHALGDRGRQAAQERLSARRISAIVRQRLGLQLLPKAQLQQPLSQG